MGLPSFLTPKWEEHQVNGETLRFYPLSLGLASRLKNIARPLLRMIAKIMEKDSDALTEKNFVTTKNEGEGIDHSDTTIKAMAADIYSMRSTERGDLVNDFVEQVFKPENHSLLCEIIMDSLREVEAWQRAIGAPIPPEKIHEFKSALDAVTFSQLMQGVLKANTKIMGSLGKQMADQVRAVAESHLGPDKSASQTGQPSSSESTVKQHPSVPSAEERPPSVPGKPPENILRPGNPAQ